ncbi:MAG TPA: OsmC family protein [Steroidobacteraceae bacterium]
MTATPHASPIQVEWAGGSQFDAGRPDGPKVRIDADARSGPGPFDMLLAAIAACAATDVVEIMRKQRTPLDALKVRVEATRVGESRAGWLPRSCTSRCRGRESPPKKRHGRSSCP